MKSLLRLGRSPGLRLSAPDGQVLYARAPLEAPRHLSRRSDAVRPVDWLAEELRTSERRAEATDASGTVGEFVCETPFRGPHRSW